MVRHIRRKQKSARLCVNNNNPFSKVCYPSAKRNLQKVRNRKFSLLLHDEMISISIIEAEQIYKLFLLQSLHTGSLFGTLRASLMLKLKNIFDASRSSSLQC